MKVLLTYTCPNWSLTKKHSNKLRTCQRAIERKILGANLTNKIRSNIIRKKKTSIKDITLRTKKMKWTWAAHIARTNDERWTTAWTSRDDKKGRQRRRWTNDLITVTPSFSPDFASLDYHLPGPFKKTLRGR